MEFPPRIMPITHYGRPDPILSAYADATDENGARTDI